MKYLLILIICISIAACNSSKESTGKNDYKSETDSLVLINYPLLKEYAVCRCLYAVPENNSLENLDISPSLYANLLNYVGIDTLSKLAKEEGLRITAEKYVDYQNKKASFYRCSQWANSPSVDSLLWNFARSIKSE